MKLSACWGKNTTKRTKCQQMFLQFALTYQFNLDKGTTEVNCKVRIALKI